jgi:hypothetical protein
MKETTILDNPQRADGWCESAVCLIASSIPESLR